MDRYQKKLIAEMVGRNTLFDIMLRLLYFFEPGEAAQIITELQIRLVSDELDDVLLSCVQLFDDPPSTIKIFTALGIKNPSIKSVLPQLAMLVDGVGKNRLAFGLPGARPGYLFAGYLEDKAIIRLIAQVQIPTADSMSSLDYQNYERAQIGLLPARPSTNSDDYYTWQALHLVS